jgi:hypothetical protein
MVRFMKFLSLPFLQRTFSIWISYGVQRGVHLIPCFAEGLTGDFLESSIARLPDEGDMDWRCYYVNM